MIIDVLDFRHGQTAVFNEKYSPANYESSSIIHRDCYAAALIINKLKPDRQEAIAKYIERSEIEEVLSIAALQDSYQSDKQKTRLIKKTNQNKNSHRAC